MTNIPIPRWARISIALTCAGIGLASSAVTGRLLVRGLELTEPDASSRAILTASGVLMITVELVAFFLAALLPEAKLYRLRVMGLALWLFGVVTIFGTRLVLNHNAEAAVSAQAMRADNLRASIASRLADADRVRSNGERQNASDNAWTRHLGALAIKQADAMERDIEPLRDELADLQGQQHTTLPRVLGPELALAHSVAMPVLISSIGLTMFGVAGVMLRRQTDGSESTAPVRSVQQQADQTTAPDTVPDAVPSESEAVPADPVGLAKGDLDVANPAPAAPPPPRIITLPTQTLEPAPRHRTALPAGAVPAVPSATSTASTWRAVASAVIPLTAMSAAPVAMAASVEQASTVPAAAPLNVQAVPETVPAPTADEVQPDDNRYQRIRVGVLAGTVVPSVRGMRDARVSTDIARRYLKQLAAEGVLIKRGQGYALAPRPSENSDLFV